MYASAMDEFSVLAYAQHHPGTIQFLQNRFNDFATQASTMLTDFGRSFVDNSRKAFEYAIGSEAMTYASGVLRKAQSMFQRNEFKDLWTVADVQQSPQVMHRWLMAMPEARLLYLDQRVCGFEGTYENKDGDLVGVDHHDYRLMTHGVVRDDEVHGWRQSYYCDGIDEDNAVNRTHPDMKFTIQSAWGIMGHAFSVAGGDDPVSPFGDKL